MFASIDFLESVDSTNVYLRDFLADRRPRMAVARSQTGGLGRYGRSWYSPADAGLYVSYLFFPEWQLADQSFLNPLGALAVLRSIRQLGGGGLDIGLKVPNDVLIGGRKVAGVLAEAGSSEGRIRWVILGIGVNVGEASFPPDLESSATSLAREGLRTSPLDVCGILTPEVVRGIELVTSGSGALLADEYRKETKWGCSAHPKSRVISNA